MREEESRASLSALAECAKFGNDFLTFEAKSLSYPHKTDLAENTPASEHDQPQKFCNKCSINLARFFFSFLDLHTDYHPRRQPPLGFF
jgi:hypothetical protein